MASRVTSRSGSRTEARAMTDQMAGLFVKISRLEPRHVDALDVAVTQMLTREAPLVDRGSRVDPRSVVEQPTRTPTAATHVLTLRARLEAAHTCDTPGKGF